MTSCPSCAHEIPEASHFCNRCGTPVGATGQLRETVAMPYPARTPSSQDSFEGRFLPGTLVAERYRILGLIGRGGMGEVYRAHDLRLEQQVALKFLPEATACDEGALARFYNEVRTARQVSHPNVCRVFDLGETDGQPYISMEYVNGEDLGCLLRRIGRLPKDKAVEIARKVCAGLAAAHDKGVLHRDLKPANIMLDNQGQIVIMDFGLAGVASEIKGAEIRHGTPAYMAPEQLAGKQVSIRSDIYSLGLVLYELLSGRPAFHEASMADLVRTRQDGRAPVSLATLVDEIDPSIVRVVERCLDPDPQNRPASALAVSAALPGGDPLAAALAAGELPSPEAVAAAQVHEGYSPLVALALLVFTLGGLAAFPFLAGRTTWLGRTPLEITPDALAHKAREIIRSLGYETRPLDSAVGLEYDRDFLRYLEAAGPAGGRLAAEWSSHASAIYFWYRSSTRYLVAQNYADAGSVTLIDPPPLVSGMLQVELDPNGHLLHFEQTPKEVEAPTGVTGPPDWTPLFAAAGLDANQFTATDPTWIPLAAFDTRMAWRGTYAGSPLHSLRVEAASWRGKPVFFRVIRAWTRPERMTAFEFTSSQIAVQIGLLVIGSMLLIGACLLARHNVRQGKGDRRGAFRLAAFLAALAMASWALDAHHIPASDELVLIAEALSQALLIGAVVWTLYMALEPYVRRRWPQTIISWTRVLSGRVRDPLVGSRILAGTAAGVAGGLLISAVAMIQLGYGAPPTGLIVLENLLGPSRVASFLLGTLPGAIGMVLAEFLLVFLLRVLCRNEWIAGTVFVVLFVAADQLLGPTYTWWAVALRMLHSALIVIVMIQGGLVAFVTAGFVTGLFVSFPITADVSAWYSGYSIFALAMVAGLAAFAFHTALAGRPLFQKNIFEA